MPWNYEVLACDAVSHSTCLLDIDTGGGDVLGSLAPLPNSIATEPFPPNAPIARARLGPLGVDARAGTASALPVTDEEVDLVLNCHGALEPAEVARVLTSHGVSLTRKSGECSGPDLHG